MTAHRLRIRIVLAGALGIAVAAACAVQGRSAGLPLVEEHGWVEAHYLVMARTFATEGAWALGLVPVQNNPPFAQPSDVYLHWPPLLPLLLAAAVDQWGSGEAMARVAGLVMCLAGAAGVLLLVGTAVSVEAGLIAALGWMVSPVVVRFGINTPPLHLAMVWSLLGLTCFVRALREERRWGPWTWAGLIAIALAVASSWEPVLMTVGLACAAYWSGSRRRLELALAYTAVALGTAAVVMGLYLVQHPEHVADLFGTLAVRTGWGEYGRSDLGLYDWAGVVDSARARRPGLQDVPGLLLSGLVYLGTPALAALALLAAVGIRSRGGWLREDAGIVVVALLSMWVLWYVLFPTHSLLHRYQLMAAVPAAASAVGMAAWYLERYIAAPAEGTVPAPKGWILIGTSLVLLLGVREYRPVAWWAGAGNIEQIAMGRALREVVGEDAIVLTPEVDMLVTYYSKRHVVRGVRNDSVLAGALPQARAAFPRRTLVLAIGARSYPEFPVALAGLPVVHRDTGMTVLGLHTAFPLRLPQMGLEQPGLQAPAGPRAEGGE